MIFNRIKIILVGGSWNGEGRVEIFNNGNWGTVCDDEWDMKDAQVVCRQFGFPYAVSAPKSAHFGFGSGNIWLDEVRCSGTESSIVDCSHNGWGSHDCGNSEDASVICSGMLSPQVFVEYPSLYCQYLYVVIKLIVVNSDFS